MSDQPTFLLWTAEVVHDGQRATVGYSTAGVWALLHGQRGVSGYVARTKTQLARVTGRHPWLADALCIAWDLWGWSAASPHTEQTPARASSRPTSETLV